MRNKFLCFLALASTSVLPMQAKAETMRDAVLKALEQHPTVEAAAAVEKRIQEEKREEWAGFFPEVNASATGGRVFGNNSTTRGLVVDRGEAYSYLWEGSASITQPIFNGMQTFNKVDAANARLAAQEYSVTDVQQNLALRAIQAYINVLRTREALSNIEAYRDTINAYQDQIKMMVDEGAADEAEAAQAKNISLLLEDSLVEFNGQVEAAEAEYIEIMGSMPDDDLESPDAEFLMKHESVDGAVDYARTHHPMLMSAQKKLEAAGYNAEAEEGGLFPEIDGELSYLKRDQAEEIGGEVVDQRAVLRMNWSFSLGGADLARIRQKKADYSEALANMQTSQREIIRDVRRSYSLFETVRKQNELLNERVQITKDLFDTYKIQFEGARVSLLQLMQTENQMFNTKLEAINTYYQYLTSYYTLLGSMGDLLKSLNLSNDPVQTDVWPAQQSEAKVWPVIEESTAPVEEEIVTAEIAPAAGDVEDEIVTEQIYPEIQFLDMVEADMLQPILISSSSAPEHAIQITAPEAEPKSQPQPVPQLQPAPEPMPLPEPEEIVPDDFPAPITEQEVAPAPLKEPEEIIIIEEPQAEPEEIIIIEEPQAEPETIWPEADIATEPVTPVKPAKEQIYPIEDYPQNQQDVWPDE